MTYDTESVRPDPLFTRSARLTRSLISCKLSRLVCLLAGLSAAHLLSTSSVAQVKLSVVTPINSRDVKVFLKAENFERDYTIGMDLQPWDEIRCLTGNAVVQLTSGPTTTFTASGQFRVIIMPPNGTAIAVNVLLGDADMQSDNPSNMSTPEAGMGPGKTEYAIRTRRTSQGPAWEYLVYDGDVKVSSPAFERSIKTGEKLVTSPLESPAQQPVGVKDIDRLANLYANTDVAKAQMSGVSGADPAQLFDNIRRLYTFVLSDPKNAARRSDLAIQQVNNGISSSAIYQLTKAEEYTPPDNNRQLSKIAVLKGVALTGIGSFGDANYQFKKAARINPDALTESNLVNYKLRPSVIEQIKRQTSILLSPRAQQDSLIRLINEKRLDEAIAGFSKRFSSADVTSRDYYGSAVAYWYRGDHATAGQHATHSIELNSKDHELSGDELELARRIIQPPKRESPPDQSKELQLDAPGFFWSNPDRAAKDQTYLFGLIKQRQYDEALAGFKRRSRFLNSIDYYGMAIIYYELKNFDQAGFFASQALELEKKDGLISKDGHAACTRIIQAAKR